MSRIQLLPEDVASQVAAGEVVERPASVVKELVENCLDAGARRIEVAIRRGGASLVRVTDDGSGMDRDDALLALERHATSKIRTGADLAAIRTLGFRGEALPSIASVSRFRLSTREHGAVAGTEVLVRGGKLETVRDSGEAPGTVVEARQLFFNLPARRKFLRSEGTESGHVEHHLQLQAIGHPDVAFVFLKDERLVFQLPAANTLGDRIRDLMGPGLFGDLIELPGSEFGGVSVRGYVGKPGVSRSTRSQQVIFVNGRPIESPVLNHGLREGYHTALMKGQYPVCFLFLEMPPDAVDVNVHPAKREVRFREPSLVRDALARAVRGALESGRKEWSDAFRPPAAPAMPVEGGGGNPSPDETRSLIPESEQRVLRTDWWQRPPVPEARPDFPRSAVLGPPPIPSSGLAPISAVPHQTGAYDPKEDVKPQGDPALSPKAFRILGVLGRLYVLMESDKGLVLVDQHAAHERVLFEQMRRRLEAQGVPAQRLLVPPTLRLPPNDFAWVLANLAALERMGILIEEFGPSTLKIDALPEYLIGGDPAQLVREIIDELRAATSATSSHRLGEDMIATTVCRHAVKAHDTLSGPELVKLVEDLLACELPYCCPHGRPTMIQIGYDELEKKFGRKV